MSDLDVSDLDGLELEAGDALFLDFDGTLAELGPDPDAIHLPYETAADLVRLAERLGGALAILSGRDLRDLAARTPAGVWRAGGHGIEITPPDTEPQSAPPPPPDEVLAPLRALAHPGLRLEIKGPIIALHYRAAPEAEADCLAAAAEAAARRPDLTVQAGKMVVEVKPETAHKGRALLRLLEVPPFCGCRPVMLGDDTTDEDAIAAAQDFGGVGVKVGDGPSVAQLRAADPAAVRAWIARQSQTRP